MNVVWLIFGFCKEKVTFNQRYKSYFLLIYPMEFMYLLLMHYIDRAIQTSHVQMNYQWETLFNMIFAFLNFQYGEQLYNYLYDVHKIGVASTGGLRASPTILNTESQIQKLIDAIKDFPN